MNISKLDAKNFLNLAADINNKTLKFREHHGKK